MKKETASHVFSWEFPEILRTTIISFFNFLSTTSSKIPSNWSIVGVPILICKMHFSEESVLNTPEYLPSSAAEACGGTEMQNRKVQYPACNTLHTWTNIVAPTQITTTGNFALIAAAALKLLSRKALFINRKDNRNLKSRLLFKRKANFTSKLLQSYK